MNFMWRVFGKKLIKRAVQAGIAVIGASKLAEFGVTIDPDMMVIATYTSIEAGRSFLKHKYKLSWL